MIENFSKEELNNEQWKDIFGYDGAYQVSDLGRVRSRKSGEWRVLMAYKEKCGYLKVDLFKNGKKKHFLVHRLVADVFIHNGNLLNTEINHKDENKTNNRTSNLEWCDRQYNMTYNDLHHRRKRPNYKQNEIRPIYRPDLSIDDNIKLFRAYGIECSRETVRQLRRDLGLTRKHKPYKPRKTKQIS